MKKKELLEIFERFPDVEERNRYLKATKRMKQLKGFYIHLFIYIVLNLLHFIKELYEKQNYDINENFGSILWGVVVLIHAATVYLPNLALGSDWEENKIKELMDKDKNHF